MRGWARVLTRDLPIPEPASPQGPSASPVGVFSRMGSLSRGQAELILEAGLLAPSADNRHMLRFQVGESHIHLLGSPEFEAAPFHRRILALTSLGAVVENMLLRAGVLALRAEVSWGQAPTSPLATLQFSPGPALRSELEDAIPRRCTNRRVLFRGPRVSTEQQEGITAEAEDLQGVRLLWLDTSELRQQALRLITLAESERFRSEPLHKDLFSSIRFDVGWRATVTEGLPPGALEIEPPMRPLFRALQPWSTMRPLSVLGVHRIIGLRAAYAPCRMAPHLCILATTLDLDRGAIAVGRALERVWLRATCLDLAFQPLAASTLLALEGYREVEARVRQRLVDGWAQICPNALPLIVFRTGHARAPTMRSGRRAVQDFLQKS